MDPFAPSLVDELYDASDLPEVDDLLRRLRAAGTDRTALDGFRPQRPNDAIEIALDYYARSVTDGEAELLAEAVRVLEDERERIAEDIDLNPGRYR